MNPFARLEKIIGNENLEKLENTSVLIVGVGGVGGYAVESLARSGVGTLIIVDYDMVDITNKNRQIIALNSTVGLEKVTVFKKRIEEINDKCNVNAIVEFLDEEKIENLFSSNKIDYVLDACDNIGAKKSLITNCIKRKIPFLTSMGTGNRLDPSKVELTELRKTEGDPLARILRKWANDEGIKEKIPVVYSKELPIKIRERTPGSSAFVPSTAGILMASWVVRKIISNEKK